MDLLITHSETIKCLFYGNLLTVAEVSAFTGKSIPHAMKVLDQLKNARLVVEKGLADSSGGRKPLTYSLCPDTHHLVSVAMDQFSIQMVIVDMNNNFITEVARYEFAINAGTPHQLLGYLSSFIKNNTGKKSKVISIGLTMPGFIDTVKGINHSYLTLQEQSLVDFLQQHLGLPVFLDNDSTAIALAEQKFGFDPKLKNVMVLNLGWGIGLGMILNNKIFRGTNGLAGEFSHIPLFKNGKRCNCGKRGCLETEASLIAVTTIAKEGLEQGQASGLINYADIDADAILNEAINGDAYAMQLIAEAAYHVGEGLAILIHLMNPETIVLSGKGSIAGGLWLNPIQNAINEHCIPLLTRFTDVRVSVLGANAQLVGSAALVVENFGKPLKARLAAMESKSKNKATHGSPLPVAGMQSA